MDVHGACDRRVSLATFGSSNFARCRPLHFARLLLRPPVHASHPRTHHPPQRNQTVPPVDHPSSSQPLITLIPAALPLLLLLLPRRQTALQLRPKIAIRRRRRRPSAAGAVAAVAAVAVAAVPPSPAVY